MSSKVITIKVIDQKYQNPAPYDMTIDNSSDITAYMYRDPLLMFNYKGDIYKAYDIKEKDFLRLCPHLVK